MESTKAQMRAVLPLGKYRIIERSPTGFKLALGGSTTMTVSAPMQHFDIRDGDVLTLYTEVLLKGASDAKSG